MVRVCPYLLTQCTGYQSLLIPGEEGQGRGQAKRNPNKTEKRICPVGSLCQAVQLGTTDLLKSVFVLPSITCTCHCLYSTET